MFWQVPGDVPPWRSGRVFSVAEDEQVEVSGYGHDHGFHEAADLYVRWDRPLVDPTGLAQVGLFESPYNNDLRMPVLRSLLDQRASSHGMAGLLSTSVELHAHQVTAAKRILEDHVQRYLIADEVGLGKTIETLLVLRQLMLDLPTLSASVIVPRHLAGQWQQEIDTKLHPEHFPFAAIEVSIHEEPSQWLEGDVVVVDEAHQVVGRGQGDPSFEQLREIASASPRLLLLSATPALQNERAFLGMLHLLDPDVYALDDVEGFRRRLEGRQELGRSLLGLSPDMPQFLLTGTLDRLRLQLAGQPDLMSLVDEVANADSNGRPDAIRQLRQQIADTYQVHRRMIRSRRTAQLAETFPLAGRGGCSTLGDLDDAWREAGDPLEHIREDLAIGVERQELASSDAAAVLAAVATAFPDEEAIENATATSPAAGPVSIDGAALVDSIADALTYEVHGDESAVVFVSTPRLASRLAATLADLLGEGAVLSVTADLDSEESRERVERHEHRRAQWLVCDRSAEEGTNLQHADVLVHVGLPGRVNDLEQRIGRLDRWAGDRSRPWRAVAAVPPSGVLGRWADVVDAGFGVHNRSLATLQRTVEEWSLEVWRRLLDPETDSRTIAAEVRASLESETEAVREQDAIDTVVLGQADRRFSDRLLTADGAADASFPEAFQALMTDAKGNLRFRRQGNPAENVGLFAVDDPRTRRGQAPLMPLRRLARDVVPTLEHSWAGHRKVAVERGAGLLRFGSPLVDAIEDFLWHDDRGRSWGMWRYDETHATAPELWVRVDLHLHAASEPVAEAHAIQPWVVQRRLDGAFPPQLYRIWWSPATGPTSEPRERLRLEAPYEKLSSRDATSGDFHLSRTRIGALLALLDRSLASLLDEAVTSATEGISGRGSVKEAIDRATEELRSRSAARVASLRRRQRTQLDDGMAQQDILLEEVLLPDMLRQVAQPTVALDSVGVVVLSGENPFAEEDPS